MYGTSLAPSKWHHQNIRGHSIKVQISTQKTQTDPPSIFRSKLFQEETAGQESMRQTMPTLFSFEIFLNLM